ncbi:sigma-70 family RNA polymerase sigma factor [Empedobacter stercoris]|uniref:Sigma-70 family RNA polymerase sigma factor n=1 Tax=Empedobacter stercoris TaxID=1628248 RepID=A0ABX1WID6_9FLAO|nr:sigma-70 family RNA polymerase sigma factor [Empedobacter stercoris]MCA4810254.1 sigma-70 family RNA polymerase sigma factor [Empedobacter stercoris]NOJ74438.1 sigma-70 family RNA polymerase sigma factor [Empedobacter stercoris]QNT14272.1 sigma-70 family RNA polymerase sigma factor [Empedobacter stercoris]
MYANIQLGKLYLQLDRIDEAKEILNEAKKYTSGKAYLNSFEKDIFILLLDIAIKKGNTAEELDFRRKLSELETEIKLTDGENVINEINWNIQKNNFDYKYETEKIKREKTILLKNALIIISILLIIIILFVFISFKRKMKIQNSINNNKVLKLHNEKLKSESRLNKANKTLDSYKIYLADKNTQIEILNKEIDNLSKSSNKKTEEHELQLNNLLKSHLMTDENWNNFKKVFASEKADFVSYLENNFSDLTESNLRIIYLTKLGLTNIEIAHLLGITPDSVKKAKQRLRKKYDNYELIFKGIQN